MKGFFIKAYLQKNLGDDLFVKIITEKYKENKFKIISSQNYKNIFMKNVKSFSGIIFDIVNKIIKIITLKNYSIEKLFVKFNKYIIWIGGSMFMEKNKKSYKRILMPPNKKYYILGINFGPYKTYKYLEKAKETFENAEDVCVREKYTYNLFEDLANVRLASDIVFNLDVSNIEIKNSKKIVISVMNIKKLFSKELGIIYQEKIIEICKYFIDKNYEIILMSYCKYEGDEKAIKSILSNMPKDIKEKISKYRYRGNIDEALNVMADCEIVIGTRFHSNIVGLLLGKTVIPIAYRNKTINMLEDMAFDGKYININNINEFDIYSLSDEELKYKQDISFQKQDAKKNFEILDNLFENNIDKTKTIEKKTKINQIKLGAILSYVIIGLNIIINFIYTPILIRKLGQSEYGLYNLVLSIISYLMILDLGFGNAIIKYTTKFKISNQKTEEQKLHGMFLIIYLILGIIASLIGVVLYFNIDNMFYNTMNFEELEKTRVLIKILIFNLVISFPLGIFGTIIIAYEKFIFAKLINIIRIIVTPIIMIPLLFLGYKSITLTIIVTVLNIINLVVNILYCLTKLNIKLSFKKFDIKLLKEVSAFSVYIFLNMIIDKVNWSIDQFILGSIIGTIAVSVYSIGAQLNMLYLSFSTAISGVLLPKAIKMEENKASDEEFTEMFIKIGRIQYIVLGLIITGFTIFGKIFINIWAGPEYIDAYYIACILMFPMTIPLIQSVGLNILQAKNKNRFRTIVFLFIAIGNLLISIPLAKLYQGIGSAIGTSVAVIIGQVIILNIYYYKKIKINILKFWKEIGKLTIPIAISFLIGISFTFIVNMENIMLYIFYIIIYILIYLGLIWKIGMNIYEKNILINIFKKIIKKNNLHIIKKKEY